MRRELKAYLWDILDAIQDIESFHIQSSDVLGASRLVRAALERKLEIIGEALHQREDRFPGSTRELPEVKAAIGMRNWLAHGYFAVREEILWQTVQEDLPKLRLAVSERLPSPGTSA